jgi:hypothetical protein
MDFIIVYPSEGNQLEPSGRGLVIRPALKQRFDTSTRYLNLDLDHDIDPGQSHEIRSARPRLTCEVHGASIALRQERVPIGRRKINAAERDPIGMVRPGYGQLTGSP